MIGHEPRFFPRAHLPPILPTNDNSDPNYSLKRFVQEVNNQNNRYDMNRNNLPNERQMFDPLGKYYADQQASSMKQFLKSSTVGGGPMRNTVRPHLNYFPYPMLPFSGMYYRQMGGVDLTNFGTQDRNIIRPNVDWQLEQVGEYCADLLNRDKHYWNDEETALMLELYEENRNYFNDSKTKKTKVWSVIANIINKRFNTSVNSEQCSQKYRNLKAEFLKVVDPNAVDGGAKKFGRHFVQMKRLIEAEEKPSKSNSSNNTSPSSITSKSSEATISLDIPTKPTTNTKEVSTTDAQRINPENNSKNIGVNQQQFVGTDNERGIDDNITTPPSSIVSPSNSSLTTVSPTSSSSSTRSPSSCNSSDIVSDNEASLPTHARDRAASTYTDELDGIFEEYFQARDKKLENMEQNQKENVICLKRCLGIFQKMVDDNILC